MATNQKNGVEVKEGTELGSSESSAESESRSEMADRVNADVQISEESASSEVIELDNQVLEELTGRRHKPLDTDMVQRFIGTVINGRYCVEEVIGRGGMGVVFKARHQTLDRPVVLKVLRPSKIDSELAKKRFEREAKRLCLLDHPNVVTIYDFGYHDGLGYLVMEYVDGITLASFLKGNGPLTFAQFAPLVYGVLNGLSAAHEAGIVHRDIKASNAMLMVKNNKIDRIKLLDFGLAKLLTNSENLTKKSELIGSMSAMAPERILGAEGDERVDIYAVGIMAYYLLTGKKPFEGDDVQVLYSHVHDPPPPLRDELPDDHNVPGTAIEFVNLCLAKDPEDRPRNAKQAVEWLTSTVNNRSIFRLEDHPMEVPQGDQRPEDSRSSQKILFEEGTPSWARERDSDVFAPHKAGGKRGNGRNDAASKVKPVAIALGAASVLVLGAAAWFALTGPTEPTEQPDNNVEATAAQDDSNLDAVMAQIERAVQEQRYGAAAEMLSSIQGKLSTQPELLSDAADLKAAIKKGQAMVDAQRYEKRLEIAKAISAYREVIDIDPRDATAQKKLNMLEASSLLSIEANVDAIVLMDGKQIGVTPFNDIVPAERVDIVLKADGYQDWTKSASLPNGKAYELSASLEESNEPTARRVRPTPPKPRPKKPTPPKPSSDDELVESLDNDSLMEMD